MNGGLFPQAPRQDRRKIMRPVVSETDGTREAGLAFCIVFIVGFMAAAMSHPGALTSFWVWFALLMMCIAITSGVQRGVAHLYARSAASEDVQ